MIDTLAASSKMSSESSARAPPLAMSTQPTTLRRQVVTSAPSSVIPESLRSAATTHPFSAAFLLGSALTLTCVTGAWLTKSSIGSSSTRAMRQMNQMWGTKFEKMEARLERRLEFERMGRAEVLAKLQSLEARLQQIQSGSASGSTSSGKPAATALRTISTATEPVNISAYPGPPPKDAPRPIELPSPASTKSVELPTKSSTPPAAVVPMWGNDTRPAGLGSPPPASSAAAAAAWNVTAPSPPKSPSLTPQTQTPAQQPKTQQAQAQKQTPPYYHRPPKMPFGGLRAGIGRHGPLPICDPSNPNYL